MDKNIFRFTAGKAIATMLLAATMMAGFSACSDNNDNSDSPTPSGEASEPYEEPTTDQLEVKVTYDMPTAVLSSFNDNSVGAALIKRLSKTTSTIDDNTKLVLLDGSLVKSLTEADYYLMARVIMNGGYVALHRPTFPAAFTLAMSVDDQFEAIQNDILKENGVEMSEAVANARSFGDGKMVRKVNNAFAMTNRAAEVDENTVIEELVVFSINADYVIPPYNEEETISSQADYESGQGTTVEQKVKNILNPYHYGKLADEAASWLNAKEKKKAEAQQDEEEPAEASAFTRAGSDQVINSIMSATDEFTVSGGLWARNFEGKKYYRENVSNTTIRAWSVYDFASNRDFYYVEEDHQIRMGGQNSNFDKTLYWGPYRKDGWLYTTYRLAGGNVVQYYVEGNEEDGAYAYYYGSWLSASIHRMDLKGTGKIKVEESSPDTDNNSSNETVTIGRSDGYSHSTGWSFGGSIDKNGPSFNFGYSDTNTESHETSFSLSTSMTSNDLAVKKNTHGTEVEWSYVEGHTPTLLFEIKGHEMAADILTNDCDLSNKVCWSVENPSGSYTLSWFRDNYTKAQFLNIWQNSGKRYSIGCSFTKDFILSEPRRFKKEWGCDIIVNGEKVQPGAVDLLQKKLQETIDATMFKDKFYVAESEDDAVEVIKYNVGVASKMLKPGNRWRRKIENYAASLGIEKFIIEWFTEDPALEGKDKPFKITVKIAN